MKNDKGITLLSLVATVVILALLTLVTINIALHRDTITKVKNAENEITSKLEDGEGRTDSVKREYNEMDDILSSWNKENPSDGNTTGGNTTGGETTCEHTSTTATDNGDGTHTITCTNCGEKLKTESHNYVNGICALCGNVANKAPVIVANADYKSGKTTTQFTIRMRATDAEADTLTYTLYYSTSLNGTYSKVDSTTGSAGSYVRIAKTGLSNYTPYWWYITVSDGKETVTSEKQSLKTYCSGADKTCTLATYCSEYSSSTVTCTDCKGEGKLPCPGQLEWTHAAAHEGRNCDICGSRMPKAYAGLYICNKCGHNILSTQGEHYFVCLKCSSTLTAKPCPCDTNCSIECSTCEGSGSVTVRDTYCPVHTSAKVNHYYCSTHSVNCGSSSSHSYCSHGRTTKHDD